MDTTTRTGSPLRQRMIEDMRMRKLEPRTQEGYIRAVRKLTVYLQRSPDTATVEDLRNFQLHLVDTGTSPITLNATLTGLKFFFDITLGRGELMARMQPVKLPRTVPVVLSMQEATALIAAARNIKHQAALSVAYGAGLRASEVCRLKVGDVDSERMALRVEQGKGAKDRYAMLSPVVLQRLRAWWRIGHAQGKILPGGWLFPGLDPMEPLSARQLNRAVHDAGSSRDRVRRMRVPNPMNARACEPLRAPALALRRKHLRASLEEPLDLVVERVGRDPGTRVDSADRLQRRRRLADVVRFAEQVRSDVSGGSRIRVQPARLKVARQLANHVDRNRHLAQPATLADDVEQPPLDMFSVFVIRRVFDPLEVIDTGGNRFGEPHAGRVQQGQCEPQSPRAAWLSTNRHCPTVRLRPTFMRGCDERGTLMPVHGFPIA
jgi:integrase/recombinase XerD